MVHKKIKTEALRELNPLPDTFKEYKLPPNHPLCYMITCQYYLYLYVRIDNLIFRPQKRKGHLPQGDDASTPEAAPGRVGRDEQGEANRAKTTPSGRPHLELGRLRLKTWSKSDFSIAHTTWPTYLSYIYIPGTCFYYPPLIGDRGRLFSTPPACRVWR